MMDHTDRHCRYLHRLFAPHALLYTEMIVAKAILRGDADRLLAHDAAEHPLALQLGGCDPDELARAARVGAACGHAEINLNVGCPSDRVRNGSFGACLMLKPALVADCVRRMKDAVTVPVTVKCRIGIDDRDDYGFLAEFAEAMVAAGVDALIVHARVAILGGLSPKENRQIPPLKHGHVQRLRRDHPGLPVVLNGGLTHVDQITALMPDGHGEDRGAAPFGVMLGRAAYQRPALLAELERALIDPAWVVPEPAQVLERMVDYAARRCRGPVRLHAITRHMHGLMAGREGARAWRRFLSEVAGRPEATPDTLKAALALLDWGLAA
jgi:tRNA-dihydrouridine synthase A